jgi:hypothetical protein
MTDLGIYERQNAVMVNIELARIIQADREREIEAGLRHRRLLRPADSTETAHADRRPIRPTQRPASTAALSR